MTLDFRPPRLGELAAADAERFADLAQRYVLDAQRFYQSRATWHRRFHRWSGIVTIVVGACLPVLASSSYPRKELAISIAGIVVAGVTALRGFYRWDQNWPLLRDTDLAITRAYLNWRGDPVRGAAADVATRNRSAMELVNAVLEIRTEEAKQFFRDIPTDADPRPDAQTR